MLENESENRTSTGSGLPVGGFLSWTFRGYEAFVLVVALVPILEGLLSPTAASSLYSYAGIVLAVTLAGWAVGGVLGDVTSRFIGRKNTVP